MQDFGAGAVKKVAELARLRLSEAELETFARQIGQILNYVATLDALDTSGIEPLARPFELATALRADEARPSPGAEAMLEPAAEQLYESFKVPPMIGGST